MNDEAGAPRASGDAEETHMTLGSGEFAVHDLVLSDEKPRLKFNSGVMLIVVVAAVAAGGLFSMRTLTRASGANGAPAEIVQSIDEFLDVVLKKGVEGRTGRDGVLEVLNESYTARQVPLEEVQRNPFIIGDETLVEVAPAPSVDPLIQRRRARTADFERAGGQLRVGMILMGAQPLANVNNQVVRVGEVVKAGPDVAFRVVSITSDQVTFMAEDEELGIEVERTVNLRRE